MNTDELVTAFLRSRRNAHLRPATIEWYQQILPRMAAAVGETATTQALEDFIGSAPSPETARNWLRAVRALYNWAERSDALDMPNPARNVTKPRGRANLPRVLRGSELVAIYRAAQADPVDLAAFTILLDTGIRIGELASIRIEDIEFPLDTDDDADGSRRKQAFVTVRGKTGQRRVPIQPTTVRTILPIAPLTGPLFRFNGRPVVARSLMHRIRRLMLRAGITGRKIGPHTLRHTFATEYLRGGGNLHRLMMLLGHTSLYHTRIYLHLNSDDLASGHAELSPLRLVMPRQLPLGGEQWPLQQTYLEETS